MPIPNKIDALPKEVRQELMSRIIEGGFGQYDALSEWLKSLGHDIGKSAIHRFGQKFKAIRDDLHLGELNEISHIDYAMIDLRMRCIEAAVNSRESNVLDVAQSYFNWLIKD